MIDRKKYSDLDMLKFLTFSKENENLSKPLLLKAYKLKYEQKTDKEFIESLAMFVEDSRRSTKIVEINKNITLYQSMGRFYFTIGHSRDKREKQQHIIEIQVGYWSIEIHW